MFVHEEPFLPCLILVSKASACPGGAYGRLPGIEAAILKFSIFIDGANEKVHKFLIPV
jgi:hypothetical protein